MYRVICTRQFAAPACEQHLNLPPRFGSITARKRRYHYQYRVLDLFSYYNGRFYAAKQLHPNPWQAAGELKDGVPTQVER